MAVYQFNPYFNYIKGLKKAFRNHKSFIKLVEQHYDTPDKRLVLDLNFHDDLPKFPGIIIFKPLVRRVTLEFTIDFTDFIPLEIRKDPKFHEYVNTMNEQISGDNDENNYGAIFIEPDSYKVIWKSGIGPELMEKGRQLFADGYAFNVFLNVNYKCVKIVLFGLQGYKDSRK